MAISEIKLGLGLPYRIGRVWATWTPAAAEYEAAWEHNAELREALAQVRQTLLGYEKALREAADVPSLIGPAEGH